MQTDAHLSRGLRIMSPTTTQFQPTLEHQRTRRILLATTLFLVALVVGHRIAEGEFNINVDESFHAFTGMYVADFLRAFPLAHPVRFTLLYYTHYPAIGLIHWPPFFYVVEGLAFLIGGPSVITARITVLLFTLFGSYFWFQLVQDLEDSYYAAASTVLLGLLPFLLLYEKAVMLEAPSLALCIAATYYWIRYLKHGVDRYVYIFAGIASLALLTKQLSIYLALFCLFTIVLQRRRYLLSKAATWKGLALCIAITAPFYGFVLKIHWKVIQYDVLKTKMPGNPFAYYLTVLPSQLGFPIVCLSLLGIATCWWWGKWENTKVMLAWIAACYLTLTFFAEKEPRYIVYWLPPFIYFALGPLISQRLTPRIRYAGVLASAILLAHSIWVGWHFERPYISGYQAAAEEVTRVGDSGFLLFDGELPANFIFFVRKSDPGRHYVVLRKALHTQREFKQWGSIEFVQNIQDLEDLINLYGIRFAIVDNAPTEFRSQELLRRYLQSSRFRLVQTIQLQTNIASWQSRELSVYENVQPTPCSAKTLHIEMMSLPYNIDVSPSQLGLECGSQRRPTAN
jgi:hypothetical protein